MISQCYMFEIIGSHPWQAEIIVLQKQRKPSKMHLCSAVILSQKHILTSASCLTDYPIKKYRVVVAGSDKNSPEQEFMLQKRKLSYDIFKLSDFIVDFTKKE